MTMTDSASHRNLYKQTGSNGTFFLSSLRESLGSSVRQEQNRQRQNIFCQRRFKVKTAHFEEEFCISELEEEELVKSNVKLLKLGQRVQALHCLSNAFARFAKNADLFLRCDGFQSLLSCFASANVEVLQAAAWCTVNLTAGVSSSESLMPVASTLLQFLHSSDPQMQELCAWALGNLAGDSSAANVAVLQSQGCVHALMQLIPSKNDLVCQPLVESVLFALTNMASSRFQCIEEMQDNGMFELVEMMMLKTTGAEASNLKFQLASLLNSIYSRRETFARYPEQYPKMCHLVSERLSELLHVETKTEYEKIVVPLLHCFANMVAVDTKLAKTTFENNPSILSSFAYLLTSKREIIVQEVLRSLANCTVNVCSRVLISFHPRLCPSIVSLCHHTDASLALQALAIMDTLTRTSTFVDLHLIGQGVIGELVPLLRPDNGNLGAVTDAALVIVKNLLSSCPQAQEELMGQHIPLPTT